MFRTVEWKDNKVFILDQTRLPFETIYLECTNHGMVADAIRSMKVRGAPAIGIAAAMGIALGARDIGTGNSIDFMKAIEEIFAKMLSTRPTAVNIRWAVERLRRLLKDNGNMQVHALKSLLVKEANKILEEDIEVNKRIGLLGAGLIKDGAVVLTHCNAGALATGGYGTATAPMLIAKEQGKRFRVFADETRPFLQGARLTTWELMQAGIQVTLITDSSAGALMKRGEVDMVIVGTDRTVRNGDVANKIGTYTLAVLAKENNIPFYVAAPLSSIDFTMPEGDMIPIEERDPSEVTEIYGRIMTGGSANSWGAVRIAPDGVSVKNIAFDVTPARYVTAIITEKGIFKPEDLAGIMDQA
ncbi:MAG: S-methyl-5-thioribose-1-phosphate isomerase [Nitrospirota bacterium]|mgnify:CR=1 FL=1